MKTLKNTFLLLGCLLFVGCSTTFKNITPKEVTQNPSNKYTVAMKPKLGDREIVKGSLKVSIIIDGKQHAMHRYPRKNHVFLYDYAMPLDQNQAKYYFLADYQVTRGGKKQHRQAKSKLFNMQLINRYVIALESDRGPVGSQIRLLGRGFTEDDRIVVGKETSRTKQISTNTLEFTIPPLPARKQYPVYLVSSMGEVKVGQLLVDPSQIHVNIPNIDLGEGEKGFIILKIDNPAPKGGIDIHVTTNIPDSIVMPKVHIPENSKTVSVPIEGKTPDDGYLFLQADGFSEKRIPVSIK